jgi:hypothetical protein
VLPQVLPRAELETWLAARREFHSQKREALWLKTYINGGKPVPDDGGAEACSEKLLDNETFADDWLGFVIVM